MRIDLVHNERPINSLCAQRVLCVGFARGGRINLEVTRVQEESTWKKRIREEDNAVLSHSMLRLENIFSRGFPSGDVTGHR